MKLNSILKSLLVLALASITFNSFAQINNWRPYDQDGVNVFEPAKDKDATFDGLKVRVGGSFAQQYQNLSHENDSSEFLKDLYDLAPGFNLATANLNIDVQLADGIRMNLENYMSARHHTEFWVKGGYIQVDKLPMFGNPQWFTDMFRVKVGHFQPNYGDAMLRRTDNGNAMHNPFVGNYIMDAFTTEIGAELYYWPMSDLMLMGGLTSGLIKGDIVATHAGKERQPALYLKAAWDKQMNEDLRVRIAASMSNNSNSGRSTLFSGDRAGSRFYGVMEAPGADLVAKFRSGRYDGGFSNKYMATQVNAFVKFTGLEFFGTYEMVSGNLLTKTGDKDADGYDVYEFADSTKRSLNQMSVDVIYRFLENESAFVGVRYNVLSGQLDKSFIESNNPLKYYEPSIDRIQVSAGWYAIKNLLLKGTYVIQNYNDFPEDNLLYGGKFNGFVIEAVAAF